VFQQAVEKKEKLIVGVNAYAESDEPPTPILYIDETASAAQIARHLGATVLGTSRSGDKLARALVYGLGTFHCMTQQQPAV